MITEWEIYWIARLDDIKTLCCLGFVASAVALAFLCCAVDDPCMKEESRETAKWWRNAVFIIILLFSVGLVFLPTTKEMVLIKVLPKVVSSEYVQKQLPKNLKEVRTGCLKLLKEVCNDGN